MRKQKKKREEYNVDDIKVSSYLKINGENQHLKKINFFSYIISHIRHMFSSFEELK